MRSFILAAIAALSLGIGSAYAADTHANYPNVTKWGPAYDQNVSGG